MAYVDTLSCDVNLEEEKMRVLLIGEYSGFFLNLKKGLEKLGVDCTLAANGDGWKAIEGASFQLFNPSYRNIFEKIFNLIIEPYISRKKLFGFDVVMVVNPLIYSKLINMAMFSEIKKHSRKFFTSISGDCVSVYKSYENGSLGYYIYDDNPVLIEQYNPHKLRAKLQMYVEEATLKASDGIIPIMYEYALGVKNRVNCLQTIPLPFDASAVHYKPNKIENNKIVIAHGVIREECKGSSLIIEALDIIKKRYPDEVEILVEGKMPLKEYLKWLNKVNILVDQCKEHCYGMNALYAMSRGCIVLGGASENSLAEFGLESCPVVHIKPDVQQIVNQLEKVINCKQKFESMGWESRKFVETFHNCERIARLYLTAWNTV